jgi:hypothetical protein
MDNDVDGNGQPSLLDRVWKYVIGLCFFLAVLAHPDSRFQAYLNESLWSVIVLGFITLYVWPFLADVISIGVLALIFLFHFAVMWALYPRIPHHGYIAMGLVALAEIAICGLPVVWLVVRHQRLKRKPSAH